jgi:hypothetical protein
MEQATGAYQPGVTLVTPYRLSGRTFDYHYLDAPDTYRVSCGLTLRGFQLCLLHHHAFVDYIPTSRYGRYYGTP